MLTPLTLVHPWKFAAVLSEPDFSVPLTPAIVGQYCYRIHGSLSWSHLGDMSEMQFVVYWEFEVVHFKSEVSSILQCLSISGACFCRTR